MLVTRPTNRFRRPPDLGRVPHRRRLALRELRQREAVDDLAVASSVSTGNIPTSIHRRTVSSLTLRYAAASRIRIFGTYGTISHQVRH